MTTLPDFLELTPAYGRDYKSAHAARADLLAGMDFVLPFALGGQYCSVRDFAAGQRVLLRYASGTRIAIVTLPPAPVA